MVGVFAGAAGVCALAAVLLFVRLKGVRSERDQWRQAAGELEHEVEQESKRKSAVIDDLEREIKGLTERLVACDDPDTVRTWLDDVFAGVREKSGGQDDKPPVP